jgi:hypothetical protein
VSAADALRIPFLTPYLAGNSSRDYASGANFAVGGATALGRDYFAARKIEDHFVPSLQAQMAWFKNVRRMLSSEQGWRSVTVAAFTLRLFLSCLVNNIYMWSSTCLYSLLTESCNCSSMTSVFFFLPFKH